MARIEAMKLRLENWALWHERGESGGLGYPRQSAFSRLAGRAQRAEAVVPVDEVEASITDQAIKALQFTQPHLHRTAHVVYLDGLGVRHAALRLGKAESTVKAHLDQLDHYLQAWLIERAEQAKRAAAAAKGGFTT